MTIIIIVDKNFDGNSTKNNIVIQNVSNNALELKYFSFSCNLFQNLFSSVSH